uniref:Uncharacterized protein n=1 Tax=Elaeophora elaphi TaxID=1147741 RepID=A0A0R3RSQ6_9BILA
MDCTKDVIEFGKIQNEKRVNKNGAHRQNHFFFGLLNILKKAKRNVFKVWIFEIIKAYICFFTSSHCNKIRPIFFLAELQLIIAITTLHLLTFSFIFQRPSYCASNFRIFHSILSRSDLSMGYLTLYIKYGGAFRSIKDQYSIFFQNYKAILSLYSSLKLKLNSESPQQNISIYQMIPQQDSPYRPENVYSLLNLIEFRENIYYIFGLFCLISWFIFNLWILRDYFFPWWFRPIYTDRGLNQIALERKKMEYLRRQRFSNVFSVPVSVVAPNAIQILSQNAPPPTLLKREMLKSRRTLYELRENSQILNPLTLSVLQSTH